MKFLPFVLSLLFFSCTSKKSESPNLISYSKAAKYSNLKYGPYERNVMDVYLPKDHNAASPFVINLHGGAWTLGDKIWGAAISEYLAGNDIPVVNMNYRYADDDATHLPELLDDINSAVKYIQQHSMDWNVRSTGFSITGESAGAHLALSYAYKYPQNIKAIITRCAPTNFADPENLKNAEKNNLIGAINKMSGNKENVSADHIPQKYFDVSPVNFTKNIPTLIFHGDRDELVPPSQASQLSSVLNRKIYVHQFVIIPGAGHHILLKDQDRARIFSETLDWVNKYGK